MACLLFSSVSFSKGDAFATRNSLFDHVHVETLPIFLQVRIVESKIIFDFLRRVGARSTEHLCRMATLTFTVIIFSTFLMAKKGFVICKKRENA